MTTNKPTESLDLAQFEGHTPGPWNAAEASWSEDGFAQYVIRPVTMLRVSDSKLIAAAPALLAECKRQREEAHEAMDVAHNNYAQLAKAREEGENLHAKMREQDAQIKSLERGFSAWRSDACRFQIERDQAREQIKALREALEELTIRCDGDEGVRADGSNIQTIKAHAALRHFEQEAE